MLMATFAIVVGLVLLVWSADRFVDGAVGLAERLGMSKLMIGLTIVSLGTSAPEIFVSLMAALEGSSALVFGNAVGSNIANMGLVLGVTLLLTTQPIKPGLLREDLPALLGVTAVVGFLLTNLALGRADGLAMLAALGMLLYLLFQYKKEHPEELDSELTDIPDYPLRASLINFTLGLILLVVSARALVWGAITIATDLGVSEVVIGLTIVAIGTSLPELAASVMAAVRKHHDIAMGNIIGSNILNLLAVMGLAAVINPLTISPLELFRDYGTMIVITLLLTVFIVMPRPVRAMGKTEGSLLLLCYTAYLSLLYWQSIPAG